MIGNMARLVRISSKVACILIGMCTLSGAVSAATSDGISAYRRGEFERAAESLRPAATAGDGASQYVLGLMYLGGRGVPKSDGVAEKWFRKAAEQGHREAQNNLGGLLQRKGSFTEAYFWYQVASRAGDVNAEVNAAAIEPVINERQQITTFAGGWAPGDPVALPRELWSVSDYLRLKPQFEAAQRAGIQWSGMKIVASATTREPSKPEGPARHAEPRVTSSGTGIAISAGQIVTNFHVINGCRSVRVNNATPASVVVSDPRNDLAVLAAAVPSARVVSLRLKEASLGEEVYAVGYPLQGLLSGLNFTSGNVSAVAGLGGDSRLLQVTAPVQPGNSGGPLIDRRGDLVGVIASKLDAVRIASATGDIPQNVNFAIKTAVLRTFLDANRINYTVASSGSASAGAELAEAARGFTVFVTCLR